MSINPFEAVRDFHVKYNQAVDAPFTQDNILLRSKLLTEEWSETQQELIAKPAALKQIDKLALTKELADLLYVTIGAAVTFGLPLEEVFTRTHESNMTKDGGVRKDGKVLKGDGYVAPELEDLFND